MSFWKSEMPALAHVYDTDMARRLNLIFVFEHFLISVGNLLGNCDLISIVLKTAQHSELRRNRDVLS